MKVSRLVTAVIEAGRPIADNYLQNLDIAVKHDGTPVTQVDMEVHNKLLQWAKNIPELGYIGEEGNDFSNGCEKVLYVDPLDGTGGYMRGLPTATVVGSIMSVHDDGLWYPEEAVIYNPITESLWFKENDGPTYVSENPHRPTKKAYTVVNRSPALITICTWPGVPFNLNEVEKSVHANPKLSQQQFGSIALGGGLLASGMMDATVFAGRSAVETTAMSLIVEGAGGIATDLSGKPLSGYELVKQEGKLDFKLPYGAIMSSNKELVDLLVETINYHNKDLVV